MENAVSKGVNQVGREGNKEGRQLKVGEFLQENGEEG